MEWVEPALEHARAALREAERYAEEVTIAYDLARVMHEDADDRVKQLDEVIRNLSALLAPCAETRVPL